MLQDEAMLIAAWLGEMSYCSKIKFIYNQEEDIYVCPMGKNENELVKLERKEQDIEERNVTTALTKKK